MKLFTVLSALSLALSSVAKAEDAVFYDTSPSTGRVVSIRVEENVPPKLPAVAIPVNATSEDIARAVEQLAAITPVPSPTVKVTPRYALRTRANDPVSTARTFVATYGKAFGLTNPARELVAVKEEKDSLGMSHVRFKQMYRNIPVFGAEMVAHIGADGRVKSLNGKVGGGITLPIRTRVSQSKAITLAKKIFKSRYPGLTPVVKRPVLYVYQASLLDSNNSIEAYLAWEVRTSRKGIVDESFFIDATNGTLLLSLNHVRELNRRVFDCSAELGSDNNCYSNLYVSEFNYTFGCREGLCPHEQPRLPNPHYPAELSFDTYEAYFLLQGVHDYYSTSFNRDGSNARGGNTDGSQFPLNMDASWTYVNWLSDWTDDCIGGRYFSDEGVYLCKGYAMADTLAHEYAHGVNLSLSYLGEPGALAESDSDITGEFFENAQYGTNDWIIGANERGAIRNIIDPTGSPTLDTGKLHPDRYTSDHFYCGIGDNRGAHQNSTVPSKAVYLLAEGAEFNGCSISKVAQEKIAKVWYNAITNHYTSTETFNDAYFDLIASCSSLYGAGSFECIQVARALQAVEMDQVGTCADPLHQLRRRATCTCTDSDDWRGDGNFSAQATVSGIVNADNGEYRDFCLTKGKLMENYCEAGQRRRAIVECSSGCGNNRCT